MMSRSLPTVRWLFFGGEKQMTPIPATLTYKVNYCYGITEALFITSNLKPISVVPHNGIPVRDGIELFILNSDLTRVPEGEIGEVCIASPTLAVGYLNNTTLTADKFIQNPYNPKQRLFRTGDLGSLNSDGHFVLKGRADFQVNIMGNRIELEQVEVALECHPGIKEAAVIPVTKTEATTLRAFCVPVGNKLPDLDQVSVFLADHLPRYGIPTELVQIQGLPLTSSGKKNRPALKELEVSRTVEPLLTSTQIEIAQIWSQVIGIPLKEIGLKDTFFNLGGTSLKVALVVTKLQGAPWFLNLRTINLITTPRLDKFAELVERFKNGNCEIINEENQNDYDGDSTLPSDFPLKIDSSKWKSSGRILLTGSTGYVGANFLTELLIRSRVDPTLLVTCLIRADSDAEATQRLERTLTNYGLESAGVITDPRVVCKAGDVSKPFFDLSKTIYTELSERIDVIYHLAAEVHWLKYYSELRESNVVGTRHVLTFAIQGNLKFFHYISTLGVIGGGYEGAEVLLESSDLLFSVVEKQSKDNGYYQTKRISEKLIWAAIARGLPGNVYRLGEVGCHSKKPIVNTSDFLARFFITCRKIGYFPMLDRELPYGTIDFTCGAIISIAQNPEKWNGKCFHVFENQMSYLDGFQSVKGLCGLSMTEWTAKLEEVIESLSDSALEEEYSILLQLIHNQANTTFSRKNYSNSNTKEAITGSDVYFNLYQHWNWKRYLDSVLDLNLFDKPYNNLL